MNRGKLYYLGDPQDMTKTAQGKVWQFIVSSEEFASIRNTLWIVHHMRVAEGIKVRCLTETKPNPKAEQVIATLEDAYLWLLDKREPAEITAVEDGAE